MNLLARCAAAWAEVDRLRATTVDREHFDRKIREWVALYDEEQAKRRAVEQRLRGAVEQLEQMRAELRAAEQVLVAADRVREAYEAMTEGRDLGKLPDWTG